MEEKILLSIIVVSYNNARYLGICFDSILRQKTDFEYEVIVGDDGSSDNSLEIIKKYEKSFKNFSYFIQDRPSNLKRKDIIPSIRVSNIIFRAMKMARGKYINSISSDDYYINDNYFFNGVNFLKKNKTYSGYATSFYYAYQDGTMEPQNLINPKGLDFYFYTYLQISCYIFRKLPEKILPKFICDDDTLSLSIGLYGKIKYANDFSLAYRQQEKSIMHTQSECENDLLHMLMLQESLNTRPTSFLKIVRFIRLYIITCGRYAPYFFRFKGQKEKYLNDVNFYKYAETSKKYPNDIIGAVANTSVSNVLFLKTISFFSLVHEKCFLIYPLKKKLSPATSISIPNYKFVYKKITYHVHTFFKQHDSTFIQGWCFCESSSCEVYIKAADSFYHAISIARPDIRDYFSLPYIDYGFACKIPQRTEVFDLYLIDHKDKSIYIQNNVTSPKKTEFKKNKHIEKYSFKEFLYNCICKFGSITNKSMMYELAKMQEQLRQMQAATQGQQEQLRQIQAATQGQQEQLRQMQAATQGQQEQLRQIQAATQGQQDLLGKKADTLGMRQLIYETHAHYRILHQNILDRLERGEKLRFASYIVYDTSYAMHGVMAQMLKKPEKYDVKFVICPDILRDKDFSQYKKARNFFTSRYGAEKTLDGYDMKTGEFVDHSDKFDMVYMVNPYDDLVDMVHSVYYLSKQNVLPIFIDYGYLTGKWSFGHLIETPVFSLFYKVFVETEISRTEIAMHSMLGGKNLILSGYPKADALDKLTETPHTKKRILIAPHQSVKGVYNENELRWSNFLEYADFIPTLADMYPDVEFVFRPHPLLFGNLVRFGFWNQEQIDRYLELLKSKNIIYSTESEYLHLVRDCDAIIHDCGSFMVEWQYLGKPCCYVVDSEERIRGQFTKLGNFCLDKHFIANSRDKIIEFIDRFLNGEFPIKVDEDVKEKIMINYPHASEYVLEHLLD